MAEAIFAAQSSTTFEFHISCELTEVRGVGKNKKAENPPSEDFDFTLWFRKLSHKLQVTHDYFFVLQQNEIKGDSEKNVRLVDL